MNDLDQRGSRLPRSAREQRAYRLVVAGGALGIVAVVGFVLAIAGPVPWDIPVLAAVAALVCGFLFRRTVRS